MDKSETPISTPNPAPPIGKAGDGEIVVQIPFYQLIPSKTNPRKFSDAKADADLAASIKEKGVLEPLIVRPASGDFALERQPGEPVKPVARYEVVVGFRRYKAAQKAGLDDVPCLVREMTDEEAREIQIIENLQRADVSAIEEAHGLQALLEQGAPRDEMKDNKPAVENANLDRPVEDLALGVRAYNCVKNAQISTIRELVQKSASDLLRTRYMGPRSLHDVEVCLATLGLRLKGEGDEEEKTFTKPPQMSRINAVARKIGKSASYVYQRLKLCELIPEAQKAMEEGRLPAGHAVQIARMPESGQGIALEQCFPKHIEDKSCPAVSVRELARRLVDFAFVDLRQATFDRNDPDLVEAAGACPACPKLSQNSPSLKDLKPDTCTDKACFTLKAKTHVAKVVTDSRQTAEPVIPLFEGYITQQPKKHFERLNEGQFHRAGKGLQTCKSQQEGIWADGWQVGERITICADRNCKTHYPRPERGPAAKTKDQEATETKILRRAWAYAFDAALAKITTEDVRDALTYVLRVATEDTRQLPTDTAVFGNYPSKALVELRPLITRKVNPNKVMVTTLLKGIVAACAFEEDVLFTHNDCPRDGSAFLATFGVKLAMYRKQAALEVKAEAAAALQLPKWPRDKKGNLKTVPCKDSYTGKPRKEPVKRQKSVARVSPPAKGRKPSKAARKSKIGNRKSSIKRPAPKLAKKFAATKGGKKR